MTARPEPEQALEGSVARIVYHAADSGYTVLRLEVAGRSEPVTVVGRMPGVREGSHVRVTGRTRKHPRFGEQLEAASIHEVVPATATGIERYLGSGLVPGIGPEMAKRIVARFGERTLEILDREPGRLAEVTGIGPVRRGRIAEAWQSQRVMREAMVFLQERGVSPALGVRIWKRYGEETIGVVQQNPYRLAMDVWGIGFRIADRIALESGIPKGSELRAIAGLYHVLSGTTEDGHCFALREALLEEAAKVLEIDDRPLLERCLDALATDGRIVVENIGGPDRAVYDAPLWHAETRAADKLRTLAATATQSFADTDELVARIELELALHLAPQQRAAVAAARGARLLVVTGGPGTGKTTTLRAILELLDRTHAPALLGAPTGRAAKRMSEATGRPAQTLHRLLEFDPRRGGFGRNASAPLDAPVVCVDEASMIDLPLFDALTDALPHGARLVLLGDIDQLPSVGPGAVLGDVIASGAAGVVRLTEVFRQANESQIVRGAHRINAGLLPELTGDGDLFFIERSDPEAALATIRDLVATRIPRRFGLDPTADVQVLVPMHRGVCGAQNLNAALQDTLNPGGPELLRGTRRFRLGDRVMQIRNDYEREVWNGDVGIVRGLDSEAGSLQVEIDGRSVIYEATDLDTLQLAYACTVHKAQGSEFPAVVVPILTEHFLMLQRNLVYTALTRARRLAVLVGSRRALERAVKNDRIRQRNTHLAARIERATET